MRNPSEAMKIMQEVESQLIAAGLTNHPLTNEQVQNLVKACNLQNAHDRDAPNHSTIVALSNTLHIVRRDYSKNAYPKNIQQYVSNVAHVLGAALNRPEATSNLIKDSQNFEYSAEVLQLFPISHLGTINSDKDKSFFEASKKQNFSDRDSDGLGIAAFSFENSTNVLTTKQKLYYLNTSFRDLREGFNEFSSELNAQIFAMGDEQNVDEIEQAQISSVNDEVETCYKKITPILELMVKELSTNTIDPKALKAAVEYLFMYFTQAGYNSLAGAILGPVKRTKDGDYILDSPKLYDALKECGTKLVCNNESQNEKELKEGKIRVKRSRNKAANDEFLNEKDFQKSTTTTTPSLAFTPISKTIEVTTNGIQQKIFGSINNLTVQVGSKPSARINLNDGPICFYELTIDIAYDKQLNEGKGAAKGEITAIKIYDVSPLTKVIVNPKLMEKGKRNNVKQNMNQLTKRIEGIKQSIVNPNTVKNSVAAPVTLKTNPEPKSSNNNLTSAPSVPESRTKLENNPVKGKAKVRFSVPQDQDLVTQPPPSIVTYELAVDTLNMNALVQMWREIQEASKQQENANTLVEISLNCDRAFVDVATYFFNEIIPRNVTLNLMHNGEITSVEGTTQFLSDAEVEHLDTMLDINGHLVDNLKQLLSRKLEHINSGLIVNGQENRIKHRNTLKETLGTLLKELNKNKYSHNEISPILYHTHQMLHKLKNGEEVDVEVYKQNMQAKITGHPKLAKLQGSINAVVNAANQVNFDNAKAALIKEISGMSQNQTELRDQVVALGRLGSEAKIYGPVEDMPIISRTFWKTADVLQKIKAVEMAEDKDKEQKQSECARALNEYEQLKPELENRKPTSWLRAIAGVLSKIFACALGATIGQDFIRYGEASTGETMSSFAKIFGKISNNPRPQPYVAPEVEKLQELNEERNEAEKEAEADIQSDLTSQEPALPSSETEKSDTIPTRTFG